MQLFKQDMELFKPEMGLFELSLKPFIICFSFQCSGQNLSFFQLITLKIYTVTNTVNCFENNFVGLLFCIHFKLYPNIVTDFDQDRLTL